MSDNQTKNFWETRLGIITAIVTLITTIIGLIASLIPKASDTDSPTIKGVNIILNQSSNIHSSPQPSAKESVPQISIRPNEKNEGLKEKTKLEGILQQSTEEQKTILQTFTLEYNDGDLIPYQYSSEENEAKSPAGHLDYNTKLTTIQIPKNENKPFIKFSFFDNNIKEHKEGWINKKYLNMNNNLNQR